MDDHVTHELKTWPEFFARLLDGSKTFELRKDDRGFRVGDTLLLQEWNPITKEYTGRQTWRAVTYVLSGPPMGLLPGYVAMGIVQRYCEERRYGMYDANATCADFATAIVNGHSVCEVHARRARNERRQVVPIHHSAGCDGEKS